MARRHRLVPYCQSCQQCYRPEGVPFVPCCEGCGKPLVVRVAFYGSLANLPSPGDRATWASRI